MSGFLFIIFISTFKYLYFPSKLSNQIVKDFLRLKKEVFKDLNLYMHLVYIKDIFDNVYLLKYIFNNSLFSNY